MKYRTTIADICLVVLLGAILPSSPLIHPKKSMRMGDKVLVSLHHRPSDDSLHHAIQLTKDEIEEMHYYFRVHSATDEGYNQIASYHAELQQRLRYLQALLQTDSTSYLTYDTIPAQQRPLVAVKVSGGYWKAGQFHVKRPLQGKGVAQDRKGRVVRGIWDYDTIVVAWRTDSLGVYYGQMDYALNVSGQGIFKAYDGNHYEGHWQNDLRQGFGFESSPHHQLRVGEWKNGRFLGERLKYTTERIYGIDISRHQHEKGRKRFSISWKRLRILSLGKNHPTGGQSFPVSFMYIKATQSTTIQNRYFRQDYLQAKKQGIHVGAYHFFSLSTTPQAQADYFLKYASIAKTDFPPVLDVEPTEAQIAGIGGDDELMRRIRVWMEIVEKRTGKRPVLYVNQMFIFNHMKNATDIKKKYNVWIARYGAYKPDVKLAYWQLSSTGRVEGITGDVDINVFNGYQGQFREFVQSGYHR
ncbi:MAG: glycosyl hydrolase family 25 [Prevotella sp.]|nr:glycosyl hydrolase family 25 [Prevotella sp.]